MIKVAIWTCGNHAIEELAYDELLLAARKVGDKKAPRPDGIAHKALKLAIHNNSRIFIVYVNQSLDECSLPTPWKIQKQFFLPKPKRLGDPSS